MSTLSSRPLRADARRNRDAIIAAAREMFAKEGPQAQIDDIAAKAGVGIGTVYRHFATKEALLTELVRERFEQLRQHAIDALEVDDAGEALRQMLTRGAASVVDDAAFQVAMMQPDRLDWEGVEHDKQRLGEVSERVIARAREAGAVRADMTVDDIPTVMCGVTATMHFGGDWQRHLEIMLDGLRAG